jgi:hypothetical protein
MAKETESDAADSSTTRRPLSAAAVRSSSRSRVRVTGDPKLEETTTSGGRVRAQSLIVAPFRRSRELLAGNDR